MIPVRITVSIGSRKVPLDEVADTRVKTAFRSAGADIARKLEPLVCPVHKKAATNVRVHFDARGGADLQYDSCCEKLGERIGAALG
jgi:hypothetical protein